MRGMTILISGRYDGEEAVHAATRDAILGAAHALGAVVNTRWLGEEELGLYPGLVRECAGLVVAPGGPDVPREPAHARLETLRVARETGLPVLATGAGHALALIELARNAAHLEGAGAQGWPEAEHEIVRALDLPPAARATRIRKVALEATSAGRRLGLSPRFEARTDLRFGLDADYARPLEEAGLVPAARAADGRPYLHLLEGHPFHASAAYLPQLEAAETGAPPVVFRAFLEHALHRAGHED